MGPRSDWATVALPSAEVPPGAASGSLAATGWDVIVGRQLGAHTTLVHVDTDGLLPGATVSDQLNFDPPGTIPAAFTPNNWANDDQLVPWLSVRYTLGATTTTFSFITNPSAVQKTVLSQNSAERITRYQARIPGTPLFTRAYLYQYRESPVARWDVQLVHSDPTSPLLNFTIDELTLETFTQHRVDLASSLGAAPVTTVPGRFATRVLTSSNLGDGSRPTWTGISVAQPSDEGAISDEKAATAALNALGGPLVGCAGAGVWAGRWLALNYTPQVPTNTTYPGPPANGAYWDSRPLGLTKTPGQSGGQAAFGTTRGGEVVSTGDPGPLADYVYRLTTHLRPCAYYESNLDLVLAANYPNWGTWSGRTFYVPASGYTETFGKPLAVGHAQPRPVTEGWECVDEQHYAHLELAAYYALTGRVFALDLIREQTQVWLAQYFHEVDPAGSRGLGRTWLDLSAFYRLTLDPEIPAEILATYNTNVAGWQALIPGPVKAYSRMFVTQMVDPVTGNQVESGSAWQTGLTVPGLEAAFYITGNTGILISGLDCVSALVQCGWFTDSAGIPTCVDYWRFNDGAVTTPATYGATGNVPGQSHTSNFFYDWTARATLLGAIFLPPGPLQTKAVNAVAFRYSGTPNSWQAAQWR